MLSAPGRGCIETLSVNQLADASWSDFPLPLELWRYCSTICANVLMGCSRVLGQVAAHRLLKLRWDEQRNLVPFADNTLFEYNGSTPYGGIGFSGKGAWEDGRWHWEPDSLM